jgi:hypothetical protein
MVHPRIHLLSLPIFCFTSIFLFTNTSFQEFQIFFAMTTPSPEAVATFMRITGAPEFVAAQKLEVVSLHLLPHSRSSIF